MNPTVVIATHQRIGITSVNIDTLLRQTVIPAIVLVVSDADELNQFERMYPQVITVLAPNKPLGSKWQSGINKALELRADPVIITGSDDILDKRFVERACLWMDRGFDFIGVKHWYIYLEQRLYRFKYLIPMPLGGGRVYSARFLKESGPIFDPKDRHLDDLGWNKVKYANVRRLIWSDPLILSIKGEWPVMNRAEAFFKSKNCQLHSECDLSILTKDFNYG